MEVALYPGVIRLAARNSRWAGHCRVACKVSQAQGLWAIGLFGLSNLRLCVARRVKRPGGFVP